MTPKSTTFARSLSALALLAACCLLPDLALAQASPFMTGQNVVVDGGFTIQ